MNTFLDILAWMWRIAGYAQPETVKPEPVSDDQLYNGGNLPTVEVTAVGFRAPYWTKIVHDVLSPDIDPIHIDALYMAWRQYGDQIDRQFCYILATVWHECRFRPGPERRAHKYRQPRLWKLQERYWPSGYYGRGYVQLTWKTNYERFSRILGMNLVADPDLVNRPHIGAAITVIGMTEGYFTGKNMSYYLDNDPPEWVEARRVVNGLDKAREIAATAQLIYNTHNQNKLA